MNPVYIAAPFGAPTQELRALNTGRAVLLARAAYIDRLLPVCQHPLILAGVFGDDETPAQRRRGMAASLEALGLVQRHTGGRLWVLEVAAGVVSDGTQQEIRSWRLRPGSSHRKPTRRGPWSAWENYLLAHGLWQEWDRLGREHLRASIAAGVTVVGAAAR